MILLLCYSKLTYSLIMSHQIDIIKIPNCFQPFHPKMHKEPFTNLWKRLIGHGSLQRNSIPFSGQETQDVLFLLRDSEVCNWFAHHVSRVVRGHLVDVGGHHQDAMGGRFRDQNEEAAELLRNTDQKLALSMLCSASLTECSS